MSRVTWRGVTVDQRTAAMLDEVAALSGRIYVRPTQGSYSGSVSASAGTHDGCGAVDIITGSPADMRALVPILRRVGFAAWLRTPAQSSWPYHVHAIAVQPGGKSDRGCLSSGAHAQVVDYYNGLNGLAGRGRDDGPRDHVGVTWETYQKSKQPPKEWDDMASKQEIRDVVREEVAKAVPSIAKAINEVLGDFDWHGKPRPNTPGKKADKRLRDIEIVVRRSEE